MPPRLDSTDPGFVAYLRAELEERLEQLAVERARIQRALKVLADPIAPTPIDDQVLMAVAAAPGSRGSLIALSLNDSAETVARVLDELAARGLVERNRLGWVPRRVSRDT